MANGDYGYFGKGDTGYAQYMTAFNRNFGSSSGGGGGGGNHNNGGGGGDGSGCGCSGRTLSVKCEAAGAEGKRLLKPMYRTCPRRVGTSPPGAFLFFTIFSAGENHGILNATNPK